MLKIFSGLCIRRPAVVSPPLTTFQRQMLDFYAQLEVQDSHLSAHEVRHNKDLERMAQMAQEQQRDASKKGTTGTQSRRATTGGGDDKSSLLTAKDLELTWECGEKEFWTEISSLGVKPSGQEGESKANPEDSCKTTAWRKLDRNLVLLIRQQLGDSFDWGLPVLEVTGDATLRSTAEELARRLLPPEAHCTIVGNAPVAVHKYAYRTANGKQGVQMYFLNAFVDKLWHGENVFAEADGKGKEEGANFAWTSVDEMGDFLKDRKFLRRLRTFIVEY